MPTPAIRPLRTALMLTALAGGLPPTMAEPVTAEDAAELPAASASAPELPHPEQALDDWVFDEVISRRLREMIDRAEADAARDPYHRRAPKLIQSATELHIANAEREKDQAARAERDRDTVAWLLADQARRDEARAAGALAPVLVPEVLDDESRAPGWRRVLAMVGLFGVLVTAGVTALVRRPRHPSARRRRDADADTTEATDPSQRRRRRRRRRRHDPSDPSDPVRSARSERASDEPA